MPLAQFSPLPCSLVIVSAQLSSSQLCLCSPATCSGSLPVTAPTSGPRLPWPPSSLAPVLSLIEELSPWSHTHAVPLAPWAVSCSLQDFSFPLYVCIYYTPHDRHSTRSNKIDHPLCFIIRIRQDQVELFELLKLFKKRTSKWKLLSLRWGQRWRLPLGWRQSAACFVL